MNAPHTCPTCGQRATWVDDFHVDLNTNRIISSGRLVRLRPIEAEILWFLRERAPRVVRQEAIACAISPLDGMTDNCLKVHVCKLRKAMRGLPWRVRNEWGLGYQLTLAGSVPGAGVSP